MPQTLKLGATGEDAVLLQTRLNALPSTLPRLTVNGDFDLKTLERVKEFQTSEFVDGVVDPGTWAKLLSDASPQRETFYTNARHLCDPNGKRIILRGINLPLLDDWNFPQSDKLLDLEQTGANAVRIQWYINYPNPPNAVRPAYAIADLDAFLSKCRANHIIPILGLWDLTSEPDVTLLNTKLIPWWTSDFVTEVLNRHKQYLIINLANELGFYRWAAEPAAALSEFKSAYKSALTLIRDKLHMPVMIDAPDGGTSIDALVTIGQELIDHDPDHNLLLSIHAYWAAYDGFPHIATAVTANLPIVFGEVANKQDETVNDETQYCYYDLDGLHQHHQPVTAFTYQSLLKTLKEKEIGWLAWSWSPDSCASRRIGKYGQNTQQYEGLSEPFGNDIVNHPDYGFKNTAERSSIFSQGGDITNSANSIASAEGGIRDDPEGFAPLGRVNVITWKDSLNADRRMTLGAYLYQYDFSFDDGQQVVTRSANDDADGHPGFGYVVSHAKNGNSPLGKVNAPTRVETTVFSGGHHAIHRVELVYDRDKEGGGFGIKIPVVIEWFVATGRDHPIWAATWKVDQADNPNSIDFDVYLMDVRGPYGSLNFDGAASRNQGDAIGGVAWGDFGLKFATADSQLTLNSPWTYNTPNAVCFTHAWTASTNAEMGIVQTRVGDQEMGNPDRVLGREWGRTSAENYPDKGSCTVGGDTDNRNYVVPCINGWPYQLMNYDWDPTSGKLANDATGTKLIAWGSSYGWLGASSFNTFGSGTGNGRGDRSYSTFIVLGPKVRLNPANDQAGDVVRTIKAVEALNAATITNVNSGSLVEQVAKGPGATQLKNITNGYNDSYAAYYLNASHNQVAFRFTPAPGTSVRNPIFVIQNYTVRQLPRIAIDGNPITVNIGAEAGAFVSLNPVTNELWATLNTIISTAIGVEVIDEV